MNRNVCDVLLQVLADRGVRHIYGIPGDAINQLVDAIRRQDAIRFIQVRHEEAGAFAASAEAKLTGRLGVCAGTAGPGALHLLNGLYDAKMDHAPVLAITGQVARERIGRHAHQEVDLKRLFSDVAAFNQTITDPAQMPHFAVEACQVALASGTVTHLNLPEDVSGEKVPNPDERADWGAPAGEMLPCDGDLDRAAELLNEGKNIAILAGVGAFNAREELLNVAECLQAPVIRTLKAKELLPDTHPRSLGGLGMLGTRAAQEAMETCDTLLMAGTDFPYPDFYPRHARTVAIDNDPLRLGRRQPADVALLGHCRPTLGSLLPRLEEREDRGYFEAARRVFDEELQDHEKAEMDESSPIRPQRLMRLMSDSADSDAIFVCDTGTVTVWAARHLYMRDEQRFTLSSGLASMAFGLPGAIGAQLAYPERQVIALAGDGGFSMLMQDFLTAVKYKLPVKVIIFNNTKLGLIQMEQEAEGLPEHDVDLHNPDFAEFARVCGGAGLRVTKPAQLPDAVAEAVASNGPYVLDVLVNPEEKTMPPKVKAKQAFNFAVAKAREMVGS